MRDEDDIREHLSKWFDAVDKLQAMAVNFDSEVLSIMLLFNLPDSFDNFRIAIESRDTLPEIEILEVKIMEK